MSNLFLVQIFLWVGRNVKAARRQGAATMAQKYVQEKNKVYGSSKDTQVEFVDAGTEPPVFTCHFWEWRHSKNKPTTGVHGTQLDGDGARDEQVGAVRMSATLWLP